eukprot:7177336-Prymnesium_polylepis.1
MGARQFNQINCTFCECFVCEANVCGEASYKIASASISPTSASTHRVSANTSRMGRMHALTSRTTPSASHSKV